jgi:endo-1,4-beta-D-glucanase Y
MHRPLNGAIAQLSTVILISACGGTSSNSSTHDNGTGGAGGQSHSGGTNSTGGTQSLGGNAGTGGSGAIGGTNGIGGNTIGGGAGGGGTQSTGGLTGTAGNAGIGGTAATGGTISQGGSANTSGTKTLGGSSAQGGGAGTGGTVTTGGTKTSSSTTGTGGTSATGGVSTAGGTSAKGGTTSSSTTSSNGAQHPFPQPVLSAKCTYPRNADNDDVRAAYNQWYQAVVTADGAGGFLRIKKPDSGTVIGSTVSEGIGYGMILAVYMGDQSLFDNLWKYEQTHLDSSGLMNWEIGPDNTMTSGGGGAATDGDEDMAWALVMADRQWGGKGSLSDSYLNNATALINAIWDHEVDHNRAEMLKPGDQWGDVDVTNPSYFAPAYYRVFGQVTGKTQDWNKVVDSSYSIIAKSLNAASGNQNNGLVPAWCNSSGTPVEAYSGAPLYFQNDSTRTPFRVGQDYCYFGEPRAKAYLAKISSFYASVGVANIINGYNLDGTQHPEKVYATGLQAASFVGPAGVGAMSDPQYQQFVDDAYAKVATLQLTAGTIYYQKSWTALSLLMMTGNLVNWAAP